MIKTVLAVLFSCLAVQWARADEAPAGDASLRELLVVTHAHDLLDGVLGQADTTIQNSVTQAMAGKSLTPAQQRIVDDDRHQMVDMLKESLSWDTMEPLYLDAYRRSFSQSDVDGMLVFYKSPAGQAVIGKLPTVMQFVMQIMHDRMAVIMPQIQQIQQDMDRRLQATAPPADPAK
jgi:hypothetical protein